MKRDRLTLEQTIRMARESKVHPSQGRCGAKAG